ncbi:endonuclease/exonuclease/phosphatase family protein [Sinomicrobium soli]|uniref:endonuclease/exonuclease/phosphatase family protein n=1 Tax=Sinomicrobium sp. N-1-3-6 TaxID=2219864 RepID=UPI000DCD07D4|nr:endonuclease/exonuclease/phosphatase family protein [Sinomicrobium sp. N-1-3-6]RAV27737.1 endonuclease [Sinomicrobium sp. N-1-3-6]
MIRLKNITVLIVLLLAGAVVSAQELRVGSYNLRNDNPGDSLDNWKYREKTVAGLIRFHDFEIFGTQEGLKHQLEQLKSDLPGYEYTGVGRDDGKDAGEHSAIFYKTDKFELLDKGDFWLSEDTGKPNKGWDAVLPRICSWGHFKVKDTGFEFYFFNIHFDHVGKIARKESSKLILDKIREFGDDIPAILTGDFNVDQDSPSYKVLHDSDKLSDTYELAALRYGSSGTYNGFKHDSRSDSRIDHIFVTGDFKVEKHGVLTDSYKTDKKELDKLANTGNYPKEIALYATETRLPSDHYPVLVVLGY